MSLAEIYDQHRKPIIIAGVNVIALVFIITVVLVVKRTVAGPIPPAEKAPTKEVVNFIASSHFQSQSDSFKREYMNQTLNRYNSSEGIQQLSQEINNMSEKQVIQLRDNIIDSSASQIAVEAKVYNSLKDRRDKTRFLDTKIAQLDALRSMATGRGSSVGQASAIRNISGMKAPNIAANPAMSKGIPTDANPSAMLKVALERNKPSERAMGERYLSDLQQRAQQVRSYQKSQKAK